MKVMVLSSGGIDSTTAIAVAIEKYGKENVISLSIAYGQKHIKEIEASKKIAQVYGIEHIAIDLKSIFGYSNCSLLSHSTEMIPEISYDEQIKERQGHNPISTYVPFRNGLFLSSAASIALSKGCNVIFYGAHKDDATGAAYPDCSKQFDKAIKTAIWEGSGHQLKVESPFINLNKAQVIEIGLRLDAPYKYTWSCYEGKEKPCGKCGTCIDRAHAFERNGVTDPALT